jgi:hypothetical protein
LCGLALIYAAEFLWIIFSSAATAGREKCFSNQGLHVHRSGTAIGGSPT